jgi:CDP-2,3-bis-(O-geranylgeranyl)-sn-glycerol synthase
MDYAFIIQSFWIIIPAYVANASALLVGGKTPIDFGKTYNDGRRVLGDGKTWNGFITGGFIGITAGFAIAFVAPMINVILVENDLGFLTLSDFEGFPLMIPLIASITYGALLGDIIESFFKRRRGIARGRDWIPFDQIDFILGVLGFSLLISTFLYFSGALPYNWFFENLSISHILFLLVVTPFIHLFSNFIHRKAKSLSSSKQTI